VVATIPNINQSVKIAFTDGSATLAQTGATVFTLNSAALVVGETGAATTVSLTGANVLSTAAGETSTVATTAVTVLATNATPFTGSIVDADILDVGTFTLTSAAVLNGGLGGLGFANTLAVKDGANIASGVIGNFTGLLFDATGVNATNDLTMTAAQHAGFTGAIIAAGTSTNGEKITLTTIATGLSLFPVVENYVLGNFVNSVTQTAVGQAITGDAGVDTITAITGVTSTSDLAAGANVVIVPSGANISAGTYSATGGTLTFNLDNAATSTLNVTQAAGTLSATGTQNVTLSNAASSLALNAAVETFTLANATNSVTQGAVGQIIIGDAGADTVTAITAVTSTSDLKAGTNVVVVPNGANISAGTFSATGGTVGYNVDSAATGTLTPAQQALISSASGTQSLTLSAVTTAAAILNANVETFTLATSAGNSATLGANGQNIVLAGTSADTISVAGLTPTGYISGLAAADTLVLTTGADIKGLKTTSSGSAGGATGAALATVSGSVTMTNAQHAALTITASGSTDQITISDSGSGNVTAAAQIEKYVVNGTSNVTVNAATSVTGDDAGNQTVTIGGLTATGTYALGNGTDVIVTTTGANIAGVNAGLATTAETLSFAGTTTLTAAQIDGFTTLTGTSTPLLTLTTAITAAMLDDAAVSNTLTTIKLADVASNAITAANATLASGIVLNIDGSALTGLNQLTFSRGTEADGKFGIIGGAGADVFNYSTTGQLISSAVVIDTINGGAGTSDELKLTAATGTTLTIATGDSLANITNVEKITAGSSVGVISITRPATTNTNFTTIDLSGDIDTNGTNVISNTGANAITTIIGSAGIDQIALGVAAPSTSVTGGAGADTLSIATTNPVTIDDATIAVTGTSSSIETIIFVNTALTNVTVTGDSGADVITLGNFTNALNVSDVDVSVLGGTGADTITLSNGAALTAVTINGGTGTDSLAAIGNYANNAATFTDMDSLTLSAITSASTSGAFTIAGTTATAVTAPAANSIFASTSTALTTITGTATKTLALSGTGAFAVSGLTTGAITSTGSGALTVTSVDTQTVTSASATTVSLTGVGASKTLTVDGAGAFTVTGLGGGATAGTVTEGTTHTGALTVTTSGTVANAVTEVAGTNAGNIGAVTVNVVGTGLTTWTALTNHASHTATMGAGTSLTVDAASTATTYGVTITGASSHVYVGDTNTAAVDTITATNATGTTTITPNLGNDIVVLGGATDTVVFAATLALNGADTITAFTSGTDKLDLNALTTTTAYDSTAASTQNVFTTGTQAVTVTAGKLYVVTTATAGGADTAAAAATAISAGAAWTSATAAEIAYFVVVDNNSSSVWSMVEAAGAGTEVVEAELTLMGTIDATLVTGDIVIA
jgi:hypothetical protein